MGWIGSFGEVDEYWIDSRDEGSSPFCLLYVSLTSHSNLQIFMMRQLKLHYFQWPGFIETSTREKQYPKNNSKYLDVGWQKSFVILDDPMSHFGV